MVELVESNSGVNNYILEAVSASEGSDIGVLILYALVKDDDFSFIRLSAGDCLIEDISAFDNPSDLSEKISAAESTDWELKGEYNGEPLVIKGTVDSNVVGVRTFIDSVEDILALLKDIEVEVVELDNKDL